MRRRRRRKAPSGQATMSAINITPLTDVLLVLLIIFFVTAASSENRFLFQEQAGGAVVRSPGEAQVVHIRSGGTLEFEGRNVPDLEQLSALLGKDKPVILSAEDQVPFGDLVLTLDGLRARHFEKIEVEVR